MGTQKLNSKGLGILAALAVAGATGACKTVSPEDMDASMAALRAEMTEEINAGDERVAGELGGRVAGIERRMAALEADLQQMERDFEVSIARLEDELRFNVPVYFGFDDATVEAEDEAVLSRFSSVAQSYYPEALITVEGFTDPSGTEEYNLALGQRRATAVMEYLTENTALSADRVRAVSFGEDTRRLVMPDGWGPGVAGWQNRRVVLVIDHDGQPPAMATVSEGTEGG
jgi:peptidoglycan-associated lipoprotein